MVFANCDQPVIIAFYSRTAAETRSLIRLGQRNRYQGTIGGPHCLKYVA